MQLNSLFQVTTVLVVASYPLPVVMAHTKMKKNRATAKHVRLVTIVMLHPVVLYLTTAHYVQPVRPRSYRTASFDSIVSISADICLFTSYKEFPMKGF